METERRDKISKGVGLGCASQVAAFAAGYLVVVLSGGGSKLLLFFLAGWALTQWLLIVPLIIRHRRRGDRNIIKGLLVTGGLGLLLSSVCAGYIFL